MSPLPQSVREIDLLRWVAAHPNQAFDPGMVVYVKHSTDWEWQAVANQMEALARQTYIRKIKQDATGTSFWQITQRGEKYLQALESAEKSVSEDAHSESSPIALETPPATAIDMRGRQIIPPVISKAFGMSTIPVNGTSKLTFTIVNGNPNAKLTGIGFTDVLPSGLVIASPPGLVGSWGEGGLTAAAGTDLITLSDAQVKSDSFCSFQLDVEANRVGTMDNTTSPVTSKEAGVGNTASATITVVPTPETDNAKKWFDQPTIDRFSARMWTVLNRADQIRTSEGRPAVSTLFLLTAFMEQPGGQLPDLLKRVGADSSTLIPPTAKGSPEAKPEDWTNLTQPSFPPITEDVRQALVIARNMADAMGSASIEDSHLLFGVLSFNNLLVEGLKRVGLKPSMVLLPVVSQPGPSTHVTRDKWTTNDSLGYYPYAYAIYRFLTDPETKPPLAISIQAPWGGGKTSLMRMIQAQLDPVAARRAEDAPIEEDKEVGSATVKQVLAELPSADKEARTESKEKKAEQMIPPIEGGGERRFTIWFNAWKYESTEQVWAGLADCILQQVSERLDADKREVFWFRLQLRRLDPAKIRQKIHQEVLSAFLGKLLTWWLAYLGGYAAFIVALLKNHVWDHPWIGMSALLTAELGAAWAQFWKAKDETEKKPARITLGEFVRAPDYAANLGFVHQVVEDLKRVFSLVPNKDRPMVVFIDDLDRCSPRKVAAVVEAVNLFLAGEFPHCMFVLGIDDEMIAAALDQAHSDVIAKLPGYAKSASIGWRFMDKFVQLPFVIPPPGSEDLTRYADSLVSQDTPPARVGGAVLDRAARVVEQNLTSSITADQVVKQVAEQGQLAPQQEESLKKNVKIIQDMNRNISRFSDKEEKTRSLISRRAQEYFNNPRDMKRFVNLYRLYYFLRAARQARGELVVSEDQLSRWLVFSLKWPEVVRWIRRHAPPLDGSSESPLTALENTALTSSTLAAWQQGIGKAFGLKSEDTPWLSDEGLYEFFKQEAAYEDWKRLSSCDEKGLW